MVASLWLVGGFRTAFLSLEPIHGCPECDGPSYQVGAVCTLKKRFREPVPAEGLLARRFRVHLTSSTRGWPQKWTPAHASKAAWANQLPVSLSAKRTAAFRSTTRRHIRGDFEQGSASWQGQFQGQNGDKRVPRKSKRVVYLGFSPR
jgi:hypothetical protein